MKLRLGSRWWNWRESDKLTAKDGHCDYEKGEIVVTKTYIDEIDELDTAIHEMDHAQHPEKSERDVRRDSRQLAVALVKLGWHRGR